MRQLKITSSITRRNQDSLEKYLAEIREDKLITVEEEVVLAQKIKKGDEEALDKLINANLRFVISVAKQYQNQGLSLPDLINEGNLGLIKAAKRFDETRGFKFISYAVWWIRQAILQAISENSRMVRLPINKIIQIKKVNNAIMHFLKENGYLPQPDEIAKILKISKNEARETFDLMINLHVSIDAPFGDNEDQGLLGILSDSSMPKPDDSLMKESLAYDIQRVLNTLPKKYRYIICKYYGLDGEKKSLEEIGDDLGVTRERVRQIKVRAIKFLSRKKLLRQYV